jgi:predicted molibdopterin-dependent oxidoreductase YjgC
MEAPATVTLTIDGKPVTVPTGTTAAAAIMISGASCRISVSGEPRWPLCGMGVCMECCVSVDRMHHVRSCQVIVKAGMEIVTG